MREQRRRRTEQPEEEADENRDRERLYEDQAMPAPWVKAHSEGQPRRGRAPRSAPVENTTERRPRRERSPRREWSQSRRTGWTRDPRTGDYVRDRPQEAWRPAPRDRDERVENGVRMRYSAAMDAFIRVGVEEPDPEDADEPTSPEPENRADETDQERSDYDNSWQQGYNWGSSQWWGSRRRGGSASAAGVPGRRRREETEEERRHREDEEQWWRNFEAENPSRRRETDQQRRFREEEEYWRGDRGNENNENDPDMEEEDEVPNPWEVDLHQWWQDQDEPWLASPDDLAPDDWQPGSENNPEPDAEPEPPVNFDRSLRGDPEAPGARIQGMTFDEVDLMDRWRRRPRHQRRLINAMRVAIRNDDAVGLQDALYYAQNTPGLRDKLGGYEERMEAMLRLRRAAS